MILFACIAPPRDNQASRRAVEGIGELSDTRRRTPLPIRKKKRQPFRREHSPNNMALVAYFVPNGAASKGKAVVLGSITVNSITVTNRASWRPITGSIKK